MAKKTEIIDKPDPTDSQTTAEGRGWFLLATHSDGGGLFFHAKHGHVEAKDWDDLVASHHSMATDK